MVGTRQAAQRLNISQRQVRRLVASGLLRATPLGDHPNAPLAIDEASLEQLAQERAADPPRPGRRAVTERSAP